MIRSSRFRLWLGLIAFVAASLAGLMLMSGSAVAQGADLFSDDFESSESAWTKDPSSSATTGDWGAIDPSGTERLGTILQVEDASGGSRALVTDGRAGSSIGTYDVDAGVIGAFSPAFTLPAGADIEGSFDYYLGHLSNSSADDFVRLQVIPVDNAGDRVTIFRENASSENRSAVWQSVTVADVNALNNLAGRQVRLRVDAADLQAAPAGPSLVEAGFDNIVVRDVSSGVPVRRLLTTTMSMCTTVVKTVPLRAMPLLVVLGRASGLSTRLMLPMLVATRLLCGAPRTTATLVFRARSASPLMVVHRLVRRLSPPVTGGCLTRRLLEVFSLALVRTRCV